MYDTSQAVACLTSAFLNLLHSCTPGLESFETQAIRIGNDCIARAYGAALELYDAELAASDLKVRRFALDELDPWFDFVMANRHTRGFSHDYDLVIGPVANDNVFATLTLFETGVLSKVQAILQLKTYVLWDQYLFHSEKALKYLKFIGWQE